MSSEHRKPCTMHTPFLYWSSDIIFFGSITISFRGIPKGSCCASAIICHHRDKTEHFTATLLVFVGCWLMKWCDFSHMVIQRWKMLTHKKGLSPQHIISALTFHISVPFPFSQLVWPVSTRIIVMTTMYIGYDDGQTLTFYRNFYRLGFSCFSFGSDEDI